MAQAIRLGIVHFPTKQEAAIHLRRILWETPINSPLTGLDHYVVDQAYRLHPRRDRLIAIQYHQVGINYGEGYRGGTRGFHTILADGRLDTWSYKAPLNPYDDREWWRIAARNSWLPIARIWKQAHFAGGRFSRCQECERTVSWDEAQVHHMPPWEFEQIVNEFAGDRPADVVTRDGLKVLADTQGFIRFHNERADLRLLCRACHGRQRRWGRGETPRRVIKRSSRNVD